MQWIVRTVSTFRYLRTAGAFAAQRIYPPRSRLRWDRSVPLRRPFSAPTQAISAAAFIAAVNDSIKVHAASDAPPLVEETHTSASQTLDDVEEPVDIDQRSDRISVVDILRHVKDLMDPNTKALLYGIIGVNVLVTTAFRVALYLNQPPKPKPGLIRFLSKNFVLSQGWLRKGRWHVIFTCMFTHFGTSHLVRNMLGTFFCILGCSRYLSASEIAELFVAGGLVGGTFSALVSRTLGKPRYMGEVIGASDAVLALAVFLMCAGDVPATQRWLYVCKAIFFGSILREAVGFRRYLRYGLTGTGPNAVTRNHGAHLAGAATGFTAYALKYGRSPIFGGLWWKDGVDTNAISINLSSKEEQGQEHVSELYSVPREDQ